MEADTLGFQSCQRCGHSGLLILGEDLKKITVTYQESAWNPSEKNILPNRPVGRISKLEGPAFQKLGARPATILFVLFWPKVRGPGPLPPSTYGPA